MKINNRELQVIQMTLDKQMIS